MAQRISLVKNSEERGGRARADRRFTTGRCLWTDPLRHVARVDVGHVNADGDNVPLEDVPFPPQSPPSIGDTVSLAYANSSPYSVSIVSVKIGGPTAQGDIIVPNTVKTLNGLQGPITLTAEPTQGFLITTPSTSEVHISLPTLTTGAIEGTGLTITGNAEIDGTLTGGKPVRVQKAGVDVGSRNKLNLVEGTNVTLTVVDNPTDDSVDVTVAATGGGGSGVLRNGSGAPSDGLGVDGDYYLDDDNGFVYERVTGHYTHVATFMGPIGPAGADGADGAPGTPGVDGADGAPGTGFGPRGDVVLTTGSLLNGGDETGAVALGKSIILIKVAVDYECRVQLYTTAAKRDADAGRLSGIDPTPVGGVYIDHGVLLDLQFPLGTLSFDMTPEVRGSNMDGTPTTDIYYRVTNSSGATHVINVTFTLIVVEA